MQGLDLHGEYWKRLRLLDYRGERSWGSTLEATTWRESEIERGTTIENSARQGFDEDLEASFSLVLEGQHYSAGGMLVQ